MGSRGACGSTWLRSSLETDLGIRTAAIGVGDGTRALIVVFSTGVEGAGKGLGWIILRFGGGTTGGFDDERIMFPRPRKFSTRLVADGVSWTGEGVRLGPALSGTGGGSMSPFRAPFHRGILDIVGFDGTRRIVAWPGAGEGLSVTRLGVEIPSSGELIPAIDAASSYRWA